MTKTRSSFLKALLRIILSQKQKQTKQPRRERKDTGTQSPRKDTTKSKTDRRQRPPQRESNSTSIADHLLAEASNLLGAAYKYAGTSPQEGFDCSGLVYYVFEKSGFKLPRTSYLQASQGVPVALDETLPGDLLFFAHQGDKINHVGIVSSKPGEHLSMIHSSSSRGVILTNVALSEYWSPRLKGVRRIL